jgi:hypothetical protein
VPPAQPGVAYRHVDVDLAAILCFKYNCKVARDNTVKYRLHTLQLLPDAEHRSYTSVQAEVQIRLDGNMVVLHNGQVIPSQEAPPRAEILRSGDSKWNNVLPAFLNASPTTLSTKTLPPNPSLNDLQFNRYGRENPRRANAPAGKPYKHVSGRDYQGEPWPESCVLVAIR